MEKDFKIIDEKQDDEAVQIMSKQAYKQKIKEKIKAAALQYLREQQQKHSKVKEIQYIKLSIQNYILSPLFSNEEVNLLFALRSRGTDCKFQG